MIFGVRFLVLFLLIILISLLISIVVGVVCNNIKNENMSYKTDEISVIIVGLTKDSSTYISKTINRIEELSKNFKSYRVILYENDSRDNTKQILNNWKQSNNNVVILSGNINRHSAVNYGPLSTERFKIMAEYRNKCVQEMNKKEYDPFDYVIMLDVDLKDWDIQGIIDSFSKRDRWDMVFSFGVINKNAYWDTLAYRDNYHTDTLRDSKQRKSLHKKLYGHKGKNTLIPALSGFGGLAIYKKEIFKYCNYDGSNDCEHISLHECMRNKGYTKIFLNPKMKTFYN